MHFLSRLIPAISLLLAPVCQASPAGAQRIQKTWDLEMAKWSLESQSAITPEARAKTMASRPDITPYAKQMWTLIGPSLNDAWTLEPSAWFLRATPGLLATNPDGSTSPTFAKEIDTIIRTVETRHLKSPNLIPMCMALVTCKDPRSLPILEKIATAHPDKKTQGTAALAAAMILKTLGDDGDIRRKRLTHLTKAIVESWDVNLGGTTVAKLAEEELYIIRFLTKGSIAPDLNGTDSAGRPLKLSDFQGKVVLLMFWNSTMPDATRAVEITKEMERKFKGRPFVVLGVNHDPIKKLREFEADGTITWRNLSDPTQKLAGEYRVGSWPMVYVLDGERKIHYSGTQGSFAELTAEALMSEKKPAAAK